jgi:hypothetical protein
MLTCVMHALEIANDVNSHEENYVFFPHSPSATQREISRHT